MRRATRSAGLLRARLPGGFRRPESLGGSRIVRLHRSGQIDLGSAPVECDESALAEALEVVFAGVRHGVADRNPLERLLADEDLAGGGGGADARCDMHAFASVIALVARVKGAAGVQPDANREQFVVQRTLD